ncbi:hypothetical protein ACSMAD_003917 [Cronobacter sakazakii]
MSEFTTEKLNEIAETDHVQCGDASALARELLALRERAEPVAWRSDEGPFAVTRFKSVAETWAAKGWKITPLYTAPPAPVAVPDVERMKEIYSIFCTPTTGSDNAMVAIHKACRAAMLAAAPGKEG